MIDSAPKEKYFRDLPLVYARETMIMAETYRR